jgi:hypothetical protein
LRGKPYSEFVGSFSDEELVGEYLNIHRRIDKSKEIKNKNEYISRLNAMHSEIFCRVSKGLNFCDYYGPFKKLLEKKVA